ncbi:MAG: hypothetical protein ACP5FK_05425 [bacterium]
MMRLAWIVLLGGFIASCVYSQSNDIDQVYRERFTPFNVGLTYNEKIGLNAEADIYLPRTIEYRIYEVSGLVMQGPFLCLNLGYRGSGVGLGYGAFVRGFGTIGANGKVKALYTYQSNKYINEDEFYINPELELILMITNVEVGYLRQVSGDDSRDYFYWGMGIKI